jgi:TolA-binding protein
MPLTARLASSWSKFVTSKTLFFCSIATVVLVISAPQTVMAQARKAPTMAEMAAQIDQLQDQVNALTELLYTQQQAQQQATTQLAEAKAAADSAGTQARAAQASQLQAEAQIKAIPAQVKTAVAAATPAPKASWTDKTVLSGRMYYNVSAIDQHKDGIRQAPSGVGLDLKRFYIGIDHRFTDAFSGNVTTDVQYSPAIAATELYLKKAYLQAKVNNALTVRVGAADLPWVPFAEDLYGYRWVENTIADRTKFGTSADWGVHALGKIPGTPVSYAFAVLDGAGYKAPLRSKSMDFEGRVSAGFKNGVTLGVGGYSGKLGKDIQGGAPVQHTANRLNLVAAYVQKTYRVGVEYFVAEDWNNVTTLASDKADGYSVFGSYLLTDKLAAFGRYDRLRPNRTTAASREEGYYNIGLSYSPTRIVDFALMYKRDEAENGTISTSNGVIGGARKGTYDEFGLWGQWRF